MSRGEGFNPARRNGRHDTQAILRALSAAMAIAATATMVGAAAGCARDAMPTPPAVETTPDGSDDIILSLDRVLSGVYAATYAYGVAGGQLVAESERRRAVEALEEHERARDRLRTELQSRGDTPVLPLPGYSLPFPVHDPQAARALAAHVETRLASQWQSAERLTTGPMQQWASNQGRACLARASEWSSKTSSSPAAPSASQQ